MALDYRQEYQRYKRYYTSMGPILRSPVIQAYFYLLASIVTVTVFLIFAIRPTVTTIATLVREIDDKRDMAQKLDSKINSLSLLQVQYQTVEPDLPIVFSALPDNPDLPAAVVWVEETATASGVTLESVSANGVNYYSTGTVVTMPPATPVPIIIGVRGAFDNVKNFLGQLTSLPRVFAVTRVAIEKISDDQARTAGSNPELPVKLEVRAYYLP